MNTLKAVRDFICVLDKMAADDRQAAIEIIARMGSHSNTLTVTDHPSTDSANDVHYYMPTFSWPGWHICGYGVEMSAADAQAFCMRTGLSLIPRAVWEHYVEQHPQCGFLDVHLAENIDDGEDTRVFVAAAHTASAQVVLTRCDVGLYLPDIYWDGIRPQLEKMERAKGASYIVEGQTGARPYDDGYGYPRYMGMGLSADNGMGPVMHESLKTFLTTGGSMFMANGHAIMTFYTDPVRDSFQPPCHTGPSR